MIELGSDSMHLVAEVGRIVIDSGDAGQFADTITAQFALQPPDQLPSDVLTVTMAHGGDGVYKVADESRSAMSDWFSDQIDAFMAGNLVLLQVDGLAAAEANAAVRFDIEGECAICGSMHWFGSGQ